MFKIEDVRRYSKNWIGHKTYLHSKNSFKVLQIEDILFIEVSDPLNHQVVFTHSNRSTNISCINMRGEIIGQCNVLLHRSQISEAQCLSEYDSKRLKYLLSTNEYLDFKFITEGNTSSPFEWNLNTTKIYKIC